MSWHPYQLNPVIKSMIDHLVVLSLLTIIVFTVKETWFKIMQKKHHRTKVPQKAISLESSWGGGGGDKYDFIRLQKTITFHI
jgi:hypothetical protein